MLIYVNFLCTLSSLFTKNAYRLLKHGPGDLCILLHMCLLKKKSYHSAQAVAKVVFLLEEVWDSILKYIELIIINHYTELALMNGCAYPRCQMCSQLVTAVGILKAQESMFYHLWPRQVHETLFMLNFLHSELFD